MLLLDLFTEQHGDEDTENRLMDQGMGKGEGDKWIGSMGVYANTCK